MNHHTGENSSPAQPIGVTDRREDIDRSHRIGPMINVLGLEKRFGKLHVLRGLDLHMERGQVTAVVGPNGAGKSNFLDALRFTADALRASLDHALRDRGGIKEVRRRSRGHPNHFGIRLEFDVGDARGHYAFEVSAQPKGRYAVKEEECFVKRRDGGPHYYRVGEGRVHQTSLSAPPALSDDRLYLVNVSGFDEFRGLYDALSGMGFYNLNPDAIRDLQTPDPGILLNRDGSNLASVYERICRDNPEIRDRVVEYMSKVVPGISDVEHRSLGHRATLEFRQRVRGDEHPWKFIASSMSDGTLRAFAVLVALFQGQREEGPTVELVGIEEPEIALHPAAAGVLMDSIDEASQRVQVVVTSHSPDLLDNPDLSDDQILAVVSEAGETHVGPLDDAGRTALREHLYTAGELLRMDQLRPDPGSAGGALQLNLFGER